MTDEPIPSGLYSQLEDKSVSANPIPLKNVRLNVDILDFMAKVEVEQEYVNKEETPIEAIYFFPVEEEAAVTDFRAEIDGRTIFSKLKEKKAAQAEYDEAVSSGVSAVKLEQTKTDVFQINIGQLKPGAGAKVKLTYISELLVEDKKVRLSVPTTIAPRYVPEEDTSESSAKLSGIPYSLSTPAPLTIKIVARSKHKILSLTSPTHELAQDQPVADSTNPGLSMISAGIEGSICDLDRDLVVLLEAENIHDPVVYAERCSETGTVAALVSLVPKFKVKDAEAPCPELVFLVDCSGSMMGLSIDQARKALGLFLHALPAECFFNIVRYGSSFKKLFSESQKYDDDTMRKAQALVDALDANLGGTNVYDPLKWVLEKPPAAKECRNGRQVFLLTDGDVGNDEQVKKMVRDHCAKSKARVFTLGIGSGASRNLVKGVARAGSGTAVFATELEDLRPKVLKQLGDSLQPEIKDVVLQWDPKAEDNNMFSPYGQCPSVLPPVFDGQRMLSYTLFEKEIPKSVTIKAETAEGPLTVTLPVSNSPVVDGKIIHQLGARKKIQELEESSTWENTEHMNEAVLELSLTHGLASSQASFIGVDDKEDETEYACMVEREVPNQIPYSYGAVSRCLTASVMRCSDRFETLGLDEQCASSLSAPPASFYRSGRKAKGSSGGFLSSLAAPFRAVSSTFSSLTKSTTLDATMSQPEYDEDCQVESDDATTESESDNIRSASALQKDEFETLIHLQKSSGQFSFGGVFETLTGKTRTELDEGKPKDIPDDVWITALALALLKKKFSQKKAMWSLLAEKAKKWVDNELSKVNTEESKKLADELQQAADAMLK